MFINMSNNIELIQSNKTEILDMWMDYDIVKKTLKKNKFDINFFKEKFASQVFDFALSVVKSENEVGECPVINVMLILFKKKNIPLADVFLICVNLKNALLIFSHKSSILDADMIDEISMLMDYNFDGVIREYVVIYYKDRYVYETYTDIIHCETTKNIEPITIDEKPHTSASDYLLDTDMDMEMVAELHDLESDVLDTIESHDYITQDSLLESANLFEQYAKVLNMMYEFEELCYTLSILKDLLIATEFTSLDDNIKRKIKVYLTSIISDLKSWRVSIFITSEAEDIHYLDKTLMSSIAQLEITLMPQNNSQEDEEDELELF